MRQRRVWRLPSSPCTCCAQSLHVPEEGLPAWLLAASWNLLPLCLGGSCLHCSCGRHVLPCCLELPWLTTRARCGLSFRWRIRGALCNSPGSGCLAPPDFSPCLFPLLILLYVSCCNKLTVSFVSPSESSSLGVVLEAPNTACCICSSQKPVQQSFRWKQRKTGLALFHDLGLGHITLWDNWRLSPSASGPAHVHQVPHRLVQNRRHHSSIRTECTEFHCETLRLFLIFFDVNTVVIS